MIPHGNTIGVMSQPVQGGFDHLPNPVIRIAQDIQERADGALIADPTQRDCRGRTHPFIFVIESFQQGV
jgi:hypothetical protein